MSRRTIITTEYTCDRCGFVDSSNLGWLSRTLIELCPGCDLDLLQFLNNDDVAPMRLGDGYRHPDPALRQALRSRLAERGVNPYGTGGAPGGAS